MCVEHGVLEAECACADPRGGEVEAGRGNESAPSVDQFALGWWRGVVRCRKSIYRRSDRLVAEVSFNQNKLRKLPRR